MSFEIAYAATSIHEGGYSNDPNDPGGETYCGISRRWYPNWIGWATVDLLKDRPEEMERHSGLRDMVQSFYLVEYWGKLRCETISRMSGTVACELFDSAVNVSKRKAVKFLQVGLNMLNTKNGKQLYSPLKPDGLIGLKTLSALQYCLESAPNAETLIYKCQNGEQYEYYKKNPLHKRYRGWFART